MVIDLNKEFNNLLLTLDENNKPNLFLQVCCGPCSSGVLYRLISKFNVYIIFYNSNIDTMLEYQLRLYELKQYLLKSNYTVKIIYDNYNHNEFLNFVNGLENEPEGGKRCEKCFELRLEKSFSIALDYIKSNNLINDKNYLCSTLSVSPHKNAEIIYQIGSNICKGSMIEYLPSDFKKQDGYLKSINDSKRLGLYRQNYCGCEFSKCIN